MQLALDAWEPTPENNLAVFIQSIADNDERIITAIYKYHPIVQGAMKELRHRQTDKATKDLIMDQMTSDDWAKERDKIHKDLHPAVKKFLKEKKESENGKLSKQTGNDGVVSDKQKPTKRPKKSKRTAVHRDNKDHKNVPGRRNQKMAASRSKKRGR
jgi:hypothetical protein